MNLMQLVAKLPYSAKTYNVSHWAFRGHSRSPILVQIKNLYTTSYY